MQLDIFHMILKILTNVCGKVISLRDILVLTYES